MRATLTAIAAGAAVALAGCGGGGGDGKSGRTVTVAADKPIEVKADEYRFDPKNIVVTGGGERLRFRLENEGGQAHDLRVRVGGDDIGGTPIFGPGQTKEGEVTVGAKGEFEFYCSVGDHEQLGMKGKLTVK